VRTIRRWPRALRTTGPRGRGALLAVVASLALAACGTSATVKPVSEAPPSIVPKGAEIVHPAPPSAADTSCNATASLSPPAAMPTPGQMPTGSFMAQIQARGYLNVGVDQNTYLWGYRDPTTGQLTGFDIDMLDQVAQAIFGPSYPDHIRYTIVPNADRVQAVQKGLVDIVAETMTINCAREQDVDFSTVYYQAGQEILVPNNSTITGPQDLGGKRVCAANGSTSLQNLVAPGMPQHIQLWGVNNETDCLVMLQQGQVDAVSTDDAILLGLAAQDPNVKVLGPTFSSEPYGMAISKAHPEFTSFVNGVLAAVRANGTWAQIYDTWLMPYTKTPAPPPPTASYR
jgi:polar amino acid transport system substrate-binding protein